MSDERSLTVVANRLAVAWDEEAERWRAGPGGLVSALTPILRASGGTWVGWTGAAGARRAPFDHRGVQQIPVRLSRTDVRDYYDGFCNGTIWPLYHGAVWPPEIHRHWWRRYVEVNRRFTEAAAATVGPNGLVWIHDYQLQLVPQMLRQRLSTDARIGFFLHVPFPPVELFEKLPWRADILEGLLASNVVAFQTHLSVLNFGRAARRYAGARGSSQMLQVDGRKVRVEAAPISIDFQAFSGLAEEAKPRSDVLRQRLGNPEVVVLGVDRLDYTKGIDHRLRAFETLLERRPDLRGRVIYVQIAVPSRVRVPRYQATREEVERMVGRLNGSYGRPGWVPVYYLYRSIPRHELVAYYRMADVMLVTPLRDGMNLVAKEYLATRTDETGVLVLSEFAGAAEQLTQAIIVNPYDLDGLAAALLEAIELPVSEQRRRTSRLRRIVRRNDVHTWASGCLADIASAPS